MGYTAVGTEDAERVIESALDRIVQGIVNLFRGRLDAILLFGSFGRGEGGMRFEDGNWYPVNDFDLAVIVSSGYLTARSKYKVPLERLARELAKEIGIKQIDVGITHPARYRFAPNLISYYEIQHGHKVLWGDLDLASFMPSLPAENLPLLDGAIFFANRGSGLLLPALYFLNKRSMMKAERQNTFIEINKAILSIGDAYLLLNGKYDLSFRERLQRFRSLPLRDLPEGDLIRGLYCSAMESRMTQNFSWPGNSAMRDHWFQVRYLFDRFFLWFENLRLKRNLVNWIDYSRHIRTYEPDSFVERSAIRIREILRRGPWAVLDSRKSFALWQKTRQFKLCIMPLLLFSLREHTVDAEMLAEVQQLLRLSDKTQSSADWELAALRYLEIFHPGGIVADLIEDRRQ